MKKHAEDYLSGTVTNDGRVRGGDGVLYWMKQPDMARFSEGRVRFKPWYNEEAGAWYATNLRKVDKRPWK